MLFKLATRNIKRSIRDYGIYFVTLLIAVTIFYAFNSIGDQQVMKDIAESDNSNIVEFTGLMMNMFSVVVAVVLGFLVVYANQLLISRRKHEFGMYLTLGMKPSQVSRILLYETILVGIVSLALGLVLGILISQLLSFATAALFGIPLPGYQFTFSPFAFFTTLACFTGIYVIVAIFNVITVRRQKLINLLNAQAKNQRVAIRNPWLCLVLFIISIVFIGIAYWQLSLNGMTLEWDAEFMRATVFMLIGSLLFFFSLAGFVVAILTRAKGVYFKKLRPFTTRQIASKINTSFASIWVVCVLLFLATTTFATGMSLISIFTSDINQANPYDASVILYNYADEGDGTPKPEITYNVQHAQEVLEQNIPEWNDIIAGAVQLNIYEMPELTYGEIMDATNSKLDTNSTYITKQNVDILGISQYNDLLKMSKQTPVSLASNEYLVVNNMTVSEDIAQAIVDQAYSLPTDVGGLSPKREIATTQLYDFNMLSTGLTLVVPDAVIEALGDDVAPTQSIVNMAYKPNSGAEDVLYSVYEYNSGIAGITNVITREVMVGQANGLRLMITYLAVYIGLVLLVATAAVLAIQLLSLTSDSLGRYRMLSKIGCDNRMLNRSVLEQVLIYFAAPLGLALCHTACAIIVLSKSLLGSIGVNPLPTIAMTAGFLVVIYGAYMLITYLTSRGMVKQATT